MVQSTFISSQGCTEIVQRLSWSPGLSCPGPEQHCCRLAPLWTPPPPPWGSHPVEEQSQGGQNFWSSRRLWRGSRPRTPRGSLPCPPRPPCAPWSIAGADFDWEGGEADRRWLIVEVHLHSQGGRRQEEEDKRRERLADAGRRRDSEPWWLTTVAGLMVDLMVADYSGWWWIWDYCGGSHTSQALLFATIVNHAKPGENLTREETLWEEYISSMDGFGIPLCNYLCYFCDYNPDQRRCHILLIWVKWKMIDSRGSIYQNFATLFFLVSAIICWSYC